MMGTDVVANIEFISYQLNYEPKLRSLQDTLAKTSGEGIILCQ